MKPIAALIALPVLAAAFLLGPVPRAVAQDKCEELYGAWYQFLERERCLREWRRKEELRVCIAQDFGRMEELARKIRDGIEPTMYLRDAKELIEKTLGRELSVIPAAGPPRGTMLETTITSNCATPFQLIVQVRALETEELVSVKFWSRFAPPGYQEGLRTDLSRNFEDSQRRQAAGKKRGQDTASKGGAGQGENLPKKRESGTRRLREQAKAGKSGGSLTGPRFGPRGQRRVAGPGTQPWAFAAPPKDNHCAPHLARKERIWRLQRFGLVRATGPDTYRARGHSLKFAPKSDKLLACN